MKLGRIVNRTAVAAEEYIVSVAASPLRQQSGEEGGIVKPQTTDQEGAEYRRFASFTELCSIQGTAKWDSGINRVCVVVLVVVVGRRPANRNKEATGVRVNVFCGEKLARDLSE